MEKKRKKKDLATIGGRIRYARELKGLTQDEFSEKLNLESRTNIASYELNRRNVPSLLVANMAKVLDVTTDFILLGTADVKNAPLLDDDHAAVITIMKDIKTTASKEAIMEAVKTIYKMENRILN
ncbi:helix-turn-helix domain-containing protein [Butyrivibrio sp. INlla14]|uniref:helix-turn-helix domain-containing protein n=1 Tax=Butyrivibrio sp. INlla14 TaxID=1520808 RepID=UPI00087666CF|nr:helix-turn-helix transcriptional regulator [Butyrivibrio sp. INlla14]SCY11476.1 Helix-turn-helix [Butyrivibrio sp. INlla14]